jgi:hypothetical protein
MGRIWRSEAGVVLLACFVLRLAALGCIALAHPGLRAQQVPLSQQPPWLLLEAFLTWRVWRCGRISRVLLILDAMGSFAKTAFLGSGGWNLSVLALLAIYAAELALLLSPAVYLRTRKEMPPGEFVDRGVPRLWMVLTALLAGIVVTLLYLASMGGAALPGCGPAGDAIAQLPASCFGLARGFPLRFLTAYQGTPLINTTALIEDWAQWSLVSFSALYLFRLQARHRRPSPAASGRPSTV